MSMHSIFHSCIANLHDCTICIHIIIHGLNNRNVLNIGHSGNRKKSSKIPHQYNTRSKAREMAEEDETRFERLERSHQETREQISEMMEMIRALVREKGKATAPNPQNETAQPDLRREEPVYPVGFTPPYAPTSRRLPIWLCTSPNTDT